MAPNTEAFRRSSAHTQSRLPDQIPLHLQVTTTTPGNGYRPPDAAEHWILLTTHIKTHPPKTSTPPQRRSKAITHDEREGGNATHVPSRTRISPSLSGKKRAVARPLSSSHVQSSGFSVGEEAKASESETGPCSFQVCCCSEAAMNKHRRRAAAAATLCARELGVNIFSCSLRMRDDIFVLE